MGLALFTASRLFAPLHEAISWLTPGTSRSIGAHEPATTTRRRHVTINSIAHHVQTTGASGRNNSNSGTYRPLRVLRVAETSTAPACAGRMVISGRMADVCAELERLAAFEATLH